MNVAFFPYGTEQNPYQKLLKKSLEDNQINVLAVAKSTNKLSSFFQLKNIEADIVHMFWPHDFYLGRTKPHELLKKTMFMLSKHVLLKRPLIYSVENLVSHHAKSIDEERVWIQRIVDSSKGIICMSNSSLEIFKKHYKLPAGCEVEIVPHINYLSVYKSEIKKSEAREKLKIKTGEKVLLSLGRIHRYKGLDTLISSFAGISSNDSVLLIAGSCSDPSYLKQLQELAYSVKKGRVVIINTFIPDNELQIYFNASDGVVLNYNDMPMNPGSVVMSMGFGNIIVAPEIGAIRDIVNKESFIGYKNNDVTSLASAMTSFYQLENTDALGELARKRIETMHSPKVVGEKLKLLYERVLNKNL